MKRLCRQCHREFQPATYRTQICSDRCRIIRAQKHSQRKWLKMKRKHEGIPLRSHSSDTRLAAICRRIAAKRIGMEIPL